MDHVGIIVGDLAAAIGFFVELGLELQGEMTMENRLVDRIVGLEGVRNDFAFMRTPDGHGQLELIQFHSPPMEEADPHAPANTAGLRHITFAVDDINHVLGRLQARGAELVGELVNTRTATGSATSAARRGSSSSWPRRSADGSVRRRPPVTTGSEAGNAHAELREQLLGLDAELLEQAGVPLRVDLVGQLLAWIHRSSVDGSASWAESESIDRASSWWTTWERSIDSGERPRRRDAAGIGGFRLSRPGRPGRPCPAA
jgi:catechol 2,3-dioxygenase-like lactoylglutathione lyase family enzyme